MDANSSMRDLIGQYSALSWKLKLATLFAFGVVLILSSTALLNAFNFSAGRRIGVISKLSTKGIACWTMEGELAMPNFSRSGTLRSSNASVDNTFYFSVPDPDIQKQLQAIPLGSPVAVEYQQKLFTLHWPLPFLCVRRTEFEIVGVTLAPAISPDTPMTAKP
jgi:hypothetical protein